MNFFSFEFLGSFVAFFLLYWMLQKSAKVQNYLLIIAGYLFIFSFNPLFAGILFGYTLFIYLLANIASKFLSNRITFTILTIGILGCFTVFKYYSFFQESLQQAFAQFGLSIDLPVLTLLVPLGLSFYAFHSVSYVVSVGKNEIPPASFPDVVLYLCFFPSIVAGPINRAKDFLPQIQIPSRTIIEPSRAILLIILAITKLFLFSSYLSENYANPIFDDPIGYDAGQILVGIYAYAWHIYFNFSGYTNLVTGLALLLGFKVPENFNAPYLAENLQTFWHRWHISLSEFIRDYVYIPFGGNKKGFLRKNLNLFAAMVISGLWHGAGINFIIWGAIHGLGLVILNIKYQLFSPTDKKNKNIPKNPMTSFLSKVITFHFVCLAWVFFRCPTLDDALALLNQLISSNLLHSIIANGWLLIMFWGLFIIYPKLVNLKTVVEKIHVHIPWIYYPIPLAIILTLIFMLSPQGMPGFIYANF
ncbi:MBOAT family O-acyltransferase [Photorhabdus heterorhabditis]|uniref:MBOAT family O-acyltransferase n=1 Tax=Photorhabdus heterorhabditis TaxID=880156 RepID=UPI0015624C64|nr:MBOAT family O-acyltransferase [Photorhabdus heterorhabditis]NRN28933.1 MBOAT family protein [Photorhabdus heterorhabditis subsp. aluminescens]